MATPLDPALTKKTFNNWLKGALAVLFTREALTEFVKIEISDFQRDLLQSIFTKNGIPLGTTCSSCTTANMLRCPTQEFCDKRGKCKLHDPNVPNKIPNQKCPNNICHNIKDAILKHHRFQGPTWQITDATRWCSDAFQIAKCYLPPKGYDNKGSFDEIDFNGTLGVIINHTRFQNLMTTTQMNRCSKVRDMINEDIRHSASYELSDIQLARCIDALRDLLQDSKFLLHDQYAQDAVNKLKQMQSNTLVITTGDITKVLDEDISKRISEKQQEAIQSILDHLAKVQEASVASLGEITDAKDKAIKTIQDVLFKELKEDIITYYREHESVIPASPLVEEHNVSIEDLYVLPPLWAYKNSYFEPSKNRQKGDKTSGNDGQDKQEITISGLFVSGDVRYRKIYITANAGFGKTSLSQKLTMTWCQSHLPLTSLTEIYDDEDLAAMKYFDLLFLLYLRDYQSEPTCNLDDLIIKMVSENLSRKSQYTNEFIERIMHEKKCLVILDGLDEWSHPARCRRKPEVPHNNHPDSCTVLTTTRDWKIGTVGLSPKDLDRRVEISMLDKETLVQLGENAICILNEKGLNLVGKTITDFYEELELVEIGDIICNPYILLQLMYLFFGGLPIGKSKCEIYSNITEFTLERGLNKKDLPDIHVQTNNIAPVPNCMNETETCKHYFILLMKLGKLAFHTLFSEKRESSLIFDRRIVTQYMAKQEIEFCLKVGMLCQTKDNSLIAVKRYHVFFQHKSVQEFFSAIYITSEWKIESVKSTILNVCSSLSGILEMSNVFVCVCGINPEVYTCICGELQTIVDLDDVTHRYRTYVSCDILDMVYYDASRTMLSYQSMQVQCLQESVRNGHDSCSIHLHDYILTKEDLTSLKSMINFNKGNVKSLRLSDPDQITAFMQSLDPGVFTSLETLGVGRCDKEPVWLADILTESALTLKCLTLSEYGISLSASSITALTGLTCLQSLYLYRVDMTHSNLKCLYAYISQTTTLTQLKLEGINCSDHRGQYRDCDVTLDLHRLNELKILHLDEVPCRELHVNPACLEKLEFRPPMGEKMTARASSTLWQDLRSAPVLSSLTLDRMTSCQEMIQTIPTLTQLQHLQLKNIDMGDVIPRFSPDMTQLEHVKLSSVTMSSIKWRELLLSVGQLQHAVTVEVKKCNGPTRKEWRTIVNLIKTTPTLSLLHGLHIDRSDASFAIKTGSTLPLEILRMDQTAIDQYKTALATGQEKVYNIRVMIAGHCGVGKTVLTKRLLNQDVEIDTRVPTEGIDVHVGKMTVNLLDGKWTAHTDNTRQKFAERRKKILDQYTDDSKESAETSNEDFSESSVEEISENSHEEIIYERSNEPKSQLSGDHKQQQNDDDRPSSPVISESSHEIIQERSNEPNSQHSSEHRQQQDAYDRPSSPECFTKDVQTFQRQPTENEIAADKTINSRQLDNVVEEDESSSENENSRREDELREIQQLPDSDLHTAEVSIWDFAGQYAFYDTHQVFMSWRTIYLLVTDLSKQPWDIVENDDCYVDFTGRRQWNLSEFGNFWLNAIRESSAVEGNNEGPPVILVGTFADKIQDNKGIERLNAFKRALTKNNPEASILEEEHFVIDNFSKRDTFEDLRKTILEKAKAQKYWGESKPARWIDMEINLHDMNIKGIQILDKESLYKVSHLPIPKEELELFLKYHHECGNLIHFNDDDTLNRTIVLEPRFLINAFKKLNPQRDFFTNKSKALDNWVEFDKYGILPESLIYEMWGITKNENVQDSDTDNVNLELINTEDIDKSNYNKFAKDILLYLEKLGLLAKPIIKEDKINELFYFAPSFLKETIPDKYLIPAKHEVTTSKLCFTTESGFIQSAVFNKLLASCIAEYPVVYVNDRYMLFCGCGKFRFNNDNDTTLYVFFRENEIQIWLSNRNEPDKTVCKKAKEFVKGKINILKDIKYLVKSPQTHVIMEDEGFSVILDGDDRFKNLEPRSSRMTKPPRIEVDPEQLAECWFSNGTAKLEDQDANNVTENDYAKEKRFNKNCIYNGRLIELTKDEKDKIVHYCGGKTTFAGLRKIQALKSEGFAVEVAVRRVSVDEKFKKDYVLRKINASRFRHPFIAPTYTIFVQENVFYFISPYFRNGVLKSALHRSDECTCPDECCCVKLDEKKRIQIAFQVASAIQYLGESGFEHGDISSKNIVLDDDLNARLIDFKRSKEINAITTRQNSSQSVGERGGDQIYAYFNSGETVNNYTAFKKVIEELKQNRFTDARYEYLKQTLDAAAKECSEDSTVTTFKEKVVDKLKNTLENRGCTLISRSNSEREKKCDVCLINPAGHRFFRNHTLLCKQNMEICAACNYNSYFTPVQCLSCEERVKPITGERWGAILVAGEGDVNKPQETQDQEANIFKHDVEEIKGVITSGAIPICDENIELILSDRTEVLPKLQKATKQFAEMDECVAPTSLLVYFSCHGVKGHSLPNPASQTCDRTNQNQSFRFLVGSESITVEALAEILDKMNHVKTFLIILDRCYAPYIILKTKNVIQINACSPAESSNATTQGSKFTKFFVQAFKGEFCKDDEQKRKCEICRRFAANCSNYISVQSLYVYINDHLAKESPNQTPQLHLTGSQTDVAFNVKSYAECDINALLKTIYNINTS